MTTFPRPAGQLIPPIAGISYGCDYNPEQWDEATWQEDVSLMREAGVNIVAVNIFGWASIQPTQDTFDFERLDTILDLLHANGISVNLGTGTASTPPWLTAKHPEILPIMADGTTRYPGGRQAYCPSSPVFREYAARLVDEVARRYSTHPALALWHVSNELGCHNAHCYNPESAEAFRAWLRARYTTIDALNEAWGTAFWSQKYGTFEQILPPMANLSTANPSQLIDFHRFSSDELLSLYLMEKEIIQRHSNKPITTNFMVTAHIRTMDYWQWAPHMDVVANDHYLDNRLDTPAAELSFAADLTRGLAGGAPWMLMEHSTGAVNWQPLNVNKAPGEMLRNSLTHVARGSDSLCFFQWRASVQGSEKFHSAMLPHAGTSSRKWREIVDLGSTLERMKDVAGSRVDARIAMVFEWQSWWSAEGESRPSQQVTYLNQIHSMHRALRTAGHVVDVVSASSDFSAYDLVILPGTYMLSPEQSEHLRDYVAGGGNTLVTYYSGIADTSDRVYLGGYPGAIRDLLGVTVEEFYPVDSADTVKLDPEHGDGDVLASSLWSEYLHADTAEVLYRFGTGPVQGIPAITRNAWGKGSAWYLATQLDDASLLTLVNGVTAELNIPSEFDRYSVRTQSPHELDIVRRVSAGTDGTTWVFVINHASHSVTLTAHGHELITGANVAGEFTVPAGEVRIITEGAA
ncbi:beta-galactosidase [Jonesia quinghaiensis]|uniref:beta-galactosidase n=1 Tax=Jonesia quinghaiensis TaxID=262806 RepID=UPI00042584D4|nr:beta-galactosidase [Jonesia quinghaiensis]